MKSAVPCGRVDAVPDLTDRTDVDELLRAFYGRALVDPLLRPVFVDVARMDLEEHLPRIGDFWEKVLFNTATYDGAAMRVHRRLHRARPLTAELFDRWLALWDATLTEHFAGPVADAARAHAQRIAAAFLRNLAEPPTPRAELPVTSLGPTTR